MDGSSTSATQRGDSDSSRSANMPALPINDVPSPAGSTPTANLSNQDKDKPLQPGQASVSRSSSFSRAASFKFTPRDSPNASEVASPPLATSPGVTAAIASPYPSAAASVATLPASPDFGPISPGGQAIPKALHRSTSTSGPRPSSSRAGSAAVSPLTSPRDEPRGTWSVCLCPCLHSARHHEVAHHLNRHTPGQALLDREFVDLVACQHDHHGRNGPSPR